MNLYELLCEMEKRTGCYISLEPMCPQLWTDPSLALPVRMALHNHDYCRFLKRHDGNRSCAANKHYTKRIAACGRRFCGSCPYGIWEVVQPVMWKNKLAGIFYFGGFSDPSKMPDLRRYGIFQGKIPPPITPEKKKILREYAAFAAEFLLWCLDTSVNNAVADPRKQHDNSYYMGKVNAYLKQHFQENLTLAGVAAICRLTPNYMSNLIRAVSGKTFRQLLTQQRLQEAEACLKYRDMSITEISAECGFCDSNYFSTVFSKAYGCSPREYRKNWNAVCASFPREDEEDGGGTDLV